MMQKFTDYLEAAYHPLAIVTYGSYACGMNDEYSDFDCLIIVSEKNRDHDDTVIDGVPLDCFIYTAAEAGAGDVDPFLTIYDGTIIKDTDGIAAELQARVRNCVADNSVTSDSDREFITGWIRKTLRRAAKRDDEGSCRLLSLLGESLEDYFLLRNMFYFGSKRAGKYLRENDPSGYALWHEALTRRTDEAITLWMEHVIKR